MAITLPDELPNKRHSRYQEELDEVTNVKHQSVSNLRRRFDDGRTVVSEDEIGRTVDTTRTMATVDPRQQLVTPERDSRQYMDKKQQIMSPERESRPNIIMSPERDLRQQPETRVAKVSPTHKDEGELNWSQMISGLEDKIRDMEVWSPNMESTQGNVVSIERVKARTLQTIPFSEDPFWKEIEEMTSFDPNSLEGMLKASMVGVSQEAPPSPQITTLPTTHQPRPHSGISMRERLQRSKSLYTPNITPLTINVDGYPGGGKTASLERDKYSGPSALDEVLEDIRLSMEKKPLSPKRKISAGDSSDSHRSSPGPSWTSERLRTRTRFGSTGHDDMATAPWGDNTFGNTANNAHMAVSMTSQQKTNAPLTVMAGISGNNQHLSTVCFFFLIVEFVSLFFLKSFQIFDFSLLSNFI